MDCAVLSPDGRRAASVADSVLVLWDAATGERLRELPVPQADFRQLVFSGDGRRLAAAYATSWKVKGVSVFEVETGKLLWRRNFASQPGFLQFSADGKQLRASIAFQSIVACDAGTGKQLRLWRAPPETLPKGDQVGVRAEWGILSPDGKVVVWEMAFVREKGDPPKSLGLRFHDADTDKLLYQRKIDRHRVRPRFAFSLDSKRFACLCDKFIVWETAGGKELFAREIPNMEQFALAPDGRRVVSYEMYRCRLRLWNLDSDTPAADLSSLSPIVTPDDLLAPQVFSADGKTLLAATDSTVRLFDAATGTERVVSGHRSAIKPRFSADGRTLFTTCAEQKCRWDLSTESKPFLRVREPRTIWESQCLAHDAADRVVLDVSEGRVRIRETATGRIRCALEDAGRPDYGRFSANAARLLLVYEGEDQLPEKVWLYDAKTGKKTGAIQVREPVGHAAFLPDGRLVAWTDRSGVVHFHDAATGKAVRSLRCSRPLPQQVLDNAILFFSADGDYLFEGWPTLPTRVVQIHSGREIARFPVNPGKPSEGNRLSSMSCSPDSRLLASAERPTGTIRLLEIASGKVRVEFAGHRHGVHAMAFAPDGQTLASGGDDNVVFLWDVTGAKTSAAANKPSDNDLSSWWNELASEDGKRAGVAIAAMLRKPEASAAFLQEKLRPAEALDEKRLAQLIADLDDAAFETRETASRELVRLGERAEAALRRALTNRPSLEMRRRIEDILSKLEPGPLPPEMLRTLRAVEVLEHVGTPAARRCLEALAKGASEARPTRDAKAALQRLTKSRG
jgi:WD40 repeat protein